MTHENINPMASKKIMTMHPDPTKVGVNIDQEKYDQIRDSILQILAEEGKMTFTDLGDLVVKDLSGNFDGSILWYYTTVKLDLEARKLIQRVPGSKPQLVELVR